MSDFITNGELRIEAERLCDENERLESENARLLDLVRILVNCMGEVDRCDTCPINGNPYDVSVEDWFACDSLRDMLAEAVVLDG